MTTTTNSFVPPYNLTWRAFLSSLDRMAADEDLPSVIDRSYLNWMPGNVQTNYLALCRQFGLVDSGDAPTALMRNIVYHNDSRPTVIAQLIHEHYAPILELNPNSTAQQLLGLWKDTYNQSGETRRKATTFFMHAAKFSGVQIGHNWERDVAKISRQAPPARRDRPRQPRIPKQAGPRESTARPAETVDLDNDAGSLSISVEIDPLKLTEEDRDFVFDIVDSIRKYQDAHAKNIPSRASDEPDDTKN
ncbi:hypothetical protein [Saccharopolyspora griseoalba]|uniref:Uncharacterized protein n=1 Tax=Saccharopolyspora griseoalba TaxID=1431848 RepID=A0ABW2LLV2_9PSEU